MNINMIYTPLGRNKHENALVSHALGHQDICFFFRGRMDGEGGGAGGREGGRAGGREEA